ncbi:MAG: hypothetical protein B6243_00395 [Anaerolineaceae bacterium 4572_5.2]|nr:MAG: hypothetical protein B6243_00395 [Anaerolineaceae bacterium 4572_5.2]
MFKKYSFLEIALKILLVVLVVAGGVALYRFGYAHGYGAGAAVEISEGSTILPEGFYHGFAPHYMRPKGFFPGRMPGLFFGGLLLFMGIAAIRRMIWFRRWQMTDASDAEAWMSSPYFHHWGPVAPWMRKPEAPAEEKPQPED